MAEFEYSLLIVHNIKEVVDDLVQLFNGRVPERLEALDMDYRYREYIGETILPVSSSGGGEPEGRTLIIHTANSAQDYRMYWRDHIHHAVLLNLSLPEDHFSEPRKETGMKLLREIKGDHPETEVIVFTDQMIANRAIEAVKSGAFYFIQQPQIYLEFVQALVARIILMMEGAYLDALTGLYNRRFFRSTLKNYFEDSKGAQGDNRRVQNANLSLMLIDLNDFKVINDTFGHPEGDTVLRHISQQIGLCFRKTDVVGRYGGDEFAVLVPGTDHLRALEAAERMRQQVDACSVDVGVGGVSEEIHTTISIGVATYPRPNLVPDIEAFIKAADEALYHAKKASRKNIVCGYKEDGMIFSYSNSMP